MTTHGEDRRYCGAEIALNSFNVRLLPTRYALSLRDFLRVCGEDCTCVGGGCEIEGDVGEAARVAPDVEMASSACKSPSVAFSSCSPVAGFDTIERRCDSSSEGTWNRGRLSKMGVA